MQSAETALNESDGEDAGQSAESGKSKRDRFEDAFRTPVSAKDEATLSLVIVRDIAIVAALLSLFSAASSWATVSGLAFASLLASVDGLLVGAAVGAVLHEWGHFSGVRLAGGHAPLKKIGGFFPVFDFDYRNNDARSFDWMSIGGNAADIAVVLFFFFALPTSMPGATALVSGAFGFAVFAGAIEFPVIQKARRGMTAIEALSTVPRDFNRRYSRWGVAAALAAFVIL